MEPEHDFLDFSAQPVSILGSKVKLLWNREIGHVKVLHLGAGGYHEGSIPSSILKFCGMYVIWIEDDALFKGEGDVIP